MRRKKKLFLGVLLLIPIISLHSQGVLIGTKYYQVDTLIFQKQIGPGVYHSAYRLPKYPLDFRVIEVDLTNPYNEIEMVKAQDKAVATERPTSMAKRKDVAGHEVVGGTNGDFYFYKDPPEIGIPRSGQFLGGEMTTNPTGRASFILSKDKKPYIDRLNFEANLHVGASKIRIHTVNMLRLEREPNAEDFLTLYTNKFGTSTSAIAGGTKVIICPKNMEQLSIGTNDTIVCVVEKVIENSAVSPIPQGKGVLHGRDGASEFLRNLKPGDECVMAFKTRLRNTPDLMIDFKEQVGGSDAIVLKEGKELLDGTATNGSHPRTGMGFSKDSTRVYMIVADGRSAFSSGLTLKGFGQLFRSVGAWNAVNLDGGGSSVMFINDQKKANKPSGGTERPVGTGVLVVSNAPVDNEINIIKSFDKTILLPQYGFYTPRILGYNRYGALLSEKLENVTFSVAPEVGEIRNDSTFFFSGTQDGIIKANYNGVKTIINVKQVKDAKIKLRLDSVLIDNVHKYPIEVNTTINYNTLPLYPDALSWDVKDENICKIEEGVLSGIRNGRTLIIGTLGNFKDSLIVNVEIPKTEELVVDSFKVDEWKMKASSALGAVLSTENIPSNWSHGLTADLDYKTTRAPYVKFFKHIPLYSLSDTIKIRVNLDGLEMSKIILGFHSNDKPKELLNYTAKSINAIGDTEIIIPTSELFNIDDIAVFPIHFESINFYLANPTPRQYSLALKEIALCYRDFIGTNIESERLHGLTISPNPTRNKVEINLADTGKTQQVNLLNISGKVLKTWDVSKVSGNKIALNISEVSAGNYLLSIIDTKGNQKTVKVIKY